MTRLDAELERRRWLYLERIVRRMSIVHPGWIEALGWKTKDWDALNDLQDQSVCRATGYRPPPIVPDDELDRHPVAPANDDDRLLQGLARLQLARRSPERQFELFGWRTPTPDNRREQSIFEGIKEIYWRRVLFEPLEQMHVLKDTSDFGANYLMRLVYLHGETPPALRDHTAVWRSDAGFGRDVNMSGRVEATIKERFLSYKFWLDDPFAASDPARPGDREVIVAAREALAKEGRFSTKELVAEMCYWSENHHILFSTAELLAGQLWPDEIFRAGAPWRAEGEVAVRQGDLTGHEHVERAKRRVLRWLADRLRFGFSEFNAPGYYDEHLIALFNLADFAVDAEVRTRAAMVIDLVLFDLARLSCAGSFAVAAGRSHFKHKSCGWAQSVGDLAEVLFATRGGIVDEATGSAASFCTSQYELPGVLTEIAHDRPVAGRERRRLSLDFGEAALYGIGTKSEEDVLFWWSRAAFVTKEISGAADQVVHARHLLQTAPFNKMIPIMEVMAALVYGDTDDAADAFSVLTEGSALTQARLTSYRTAHAALSSVRALHQQQLCFQTQHCQATLGMGATVFVTYPPAGSEKLRNALTAAASGTGAGAGAITGGIIGSFFGPIGTAVGAGVGALAGAITAGAVTYSALTDDDGNPIETFPTDPDGPDWWTGSAVNPFVAQVDGAAIIAFSPRAIQYWLFESQTHAFFPTPAFDAGSVVQRSAPNSSEDDGKWTFGKVGDGYVGLYSAREPKWTTDGPWANRELVAEGDGNVFIIQIGDRAQFGSYSRFVDQVSHARINVSDMGDDDTQCSYDVPGGQRLELHMDNLEVRYGGPGISSRWPRFESPYVDGTRVGMRTYRYTIAHRDRTLHHDIGQLRTHGERAKVRREIDGPHHDRGDLDFRIIAHRGAMATLAENTVDACRWSLDVEGANGLALDVCVTRDGHAVCWHDPDPDGGLAVLRRLGFVDVGRFKPHAPEPDSPWRRPVVELTLAKLRAHYGYVPVSTPDVPASPIATLREVMDAFATSGKLRHVVLDGRVADPRLARAVLDALPSDPAFPVTLLFDDLAAVNVMRAAMPASDTRMTVSWRRRAVKPESPFEPMPSAVQSAIDLAAPVAVLGRFNAEGSEESLLFHLPWELSVWDGFNFNPAKNGGRQVEAFLVGPVNDELEQQWAVDDEVTGIITDEVPRLVEVVRRWQAL